jgi:plastocyanin
MRLLVPVATCLLMVLAGCFGGGDDPEPAEDERQMPEPHEPNEGAAEPLQLFDRFEERPVGTERAMRLLYGPFPIAPGSDFNRVTVELPVREGYMTAVSPNLYTSADGLTPSNQHLHIHHAHWFRTSSDPGEEYYTANLAWIFGTGEERTQGSLHDRANADPDGPRFGIQMDPLVPQALIFMLHNKMPDPAAVYVALDVTFVYGSADAIQAATSCPDLKAGEGCQAGETFHALHGKLWGTTFDVERQRIEDGGDGLYIHPSEIPSADPTRQATDALGRMFVAGADGTAIAAAGHLHPNGREVLVANLGPEGSACEADLDGDGFPGVTLFRSLKIEEETAAWPHSENYQMGATKHGWRAPVRAGDRITQFAIYDNDDYASYEAMSFVGLYVDRDQPPAARAGGTCTLENTQATLLPLDPWGGDPTQTVINRGSDEHGHDHGGDYCGIPGFRACDFEMAQPEPGVATGVVTITHFAYTPGDRTLADQLGRPIQVARGDVLTFVNDDVAATVRHTVTSCEWPCNGPYVANYPQPDGVFDSGKIGNFDPIDGGGVVTSGGPLAGLGLAEEAEPVWDLDTSELEPGLYSFYCRVHPWMRGSLQVT